MTLQTKYDIGQKVYYPTEESIDGRYTFKRVVKELTITKIQVSAWDCVGDRIGTDVSYASLEEEGFIEEYMLFPTEEAAWKEHERRERANDAYQDEVMKWGD